MGATGAVEREVPGRRVIVCDDDDAVRSVITGVVEQCAGRVIAETDRALDAMDLIARFEPDVVVLDLALAQGTGTQVVDFLARHPIPTRVILFTAFDDLVHDDHSFVTVVHKPDFDALERTLLAVVEAAAEEGASPSSERRRPVRSVPLSGRRVDDGTDHPDDFYRLLAEAEPTDTLLCLALDGLDPDVSSGLRRLFRTQDRMVRRGSSLIVLLIGGSGVTPSALGARLRDVVPDVDARTASVPVADDPVEAFNGLIRIMRGPSDPAS